MRIVIEPTTEIVLIDAETPARLWRGKTGGGVEVKLLVLRIEARAEYDLRELEAELVETAAIRPYVPPVVTPAGNMHDLLAFVCGPGGECDPE